MSFHPWLTSSELIEAIKRKIGFPISQQTFNAVDILAFANEEMMMQQVPAIMIYHEEYFVTTQTLILKTNISNYPIPKRAIGLKLRDVFFQDISGNLLEMTRIPEEDRSYWDPNNTTTVDNVQKFFLQGNDVILVPRIGSNPTGSLVFGYFLRPNQLVETDRAGIAQSFTRTLTIDNSTITVGDTVTIDGNIFTVVSGSPADNEFVIGGTSILTATNLVTAINSLDIFTASNVSGSSATITVVSDTTSLNIVSSDQLGIDVDDSTIINFDQVPTNITEGSKIDFLQTEPGHKTYSMDIKIPSGAISGTMLTLPSISVPNDFLVSDYICSAGECIIPQIPTDLHSSLADRTAARILESIGDREGAGAMAARLQAQDNQTGTLLDNRVEGSIKKVTNKHSLLRYNKRTRARRF